MRDIFFEEFKGSERLSIWARRDTIANKKSPSHWHPDVEFLCCTDGIGFVWVNSKPIPMEKGDIIVANANHIHSIQSDTSVTYFCLKIRESFFSEYDLDINTIIFEEKFSDQHACDLVAACYDTYHAETAFPTMENKKAFLTFLLYMCQNHLYHKEDVAAYSSKKYTAILDTIEYISKNYSQPLTLEFLAQRVNYSKYHFSRFFKEITGNSITDQINHIRCNVALSLLAETNLSISQICYNTGFENKSYFSKIFKKFYSCSPAEYRQKSAK